MLSVSFRPSRRFVFLFIFAASITIFFASHAQAQVTGATLSGTVKDASGAAIAQAKVTAKNVATGVVTEIPADSAGFYTIPNLLPGTYEVTFSAQGFSTQTATGVLLTVGAQQVINTTLTVGQINQKVVVSVDVRSWNSPPHPFPAK